jgi:hypothetical protein
VEVWSVATHVITGGVSMTALREKEESCSLVKSSSVKAEPINLMAPEKVSAFGALHTNS